MIVRIEEIIEQDEWTSGHGPMWGWKARATDLGTDDEVFIALNSKPGNVLKPGTEFEFSPNGGTVGVYQSGKREQANGQRPSPYASGSAKAPARPASGAANAPQGQSRHVPTMSQAVAVLRECVAAVEGWGSDAHATTLFLGRLRGDIVRDPSAAPRRSSTRRAPNWRRRHRATMPRHPSSRMTGISRSTSSCPSG